MITRTGKVTAQSQLADVPAEKVFWTKDGKKLKNLAELGEALNTMSDEVFQYHSNETKSDFAHWVAEVVKDEGLAKRLRKATTCGEAAKAVSERLGKLNPGTPR